MNKLQLLTRFVTATLLLVTASCADQPQPSDWQTIGKTMGTRFSVQVAQCPAGRCDSRLATRIRDRLRRLDTQYSHYRAESDVSLFNQHQSAEWFDASHEFVEIVNMALAISRASDGVFDVTVGQAVNAWGFGPDEAQTPPTESAIRVALMHSGYEKLESRLTPAGLRKTDPAISIDLSAIAKGYAVDQIADLLEFDGLNNYIIDIGGELRLGGVRNDGEPWRVGVEWPVTKPETDFILSPGNNAVATSGDYRNFYVQNGRRISHAIDPRSAVPVTHSLASVTVIDPLAANADAWATALLVMGPQTGLEFATQNNIPALFITRAKNGLETQQTSAMQIYLRAP